MTEGDASGDSVAEQPGETEVEVEGQSQRSDEDDSDDDNNNGDSSDDGGDSDNNNGNDGGDSDNNNNNGNDGGDSDNNGDSSDDDEYEDNNGDNNNNGNDSDSSDDSSDDDEYEDNNGDNNNNGNGNGNGDSDSDSSDDSSDDDEYEDNDGNGNGDNNNDGGDGDGNGAVGPAPPDDHRLYLAARAIGKVPDFTSYCENEVNMQAPPAAWGAFRDATANGDLYAICGRIGRNESPVEAILTSADGQTHIVSLEESEHTVAEGGSTGKALIVRNSDRAQYAGMVTDGNEIGRVVQIFVFVPHNSSPGNWGFTIRGESSEVNGSLYVDAPCSAGVESYNPFFWPANLRNFGYRAGYAEPLPTHEDNCRIGPDLSGMTLQQIIQEEIPRLEARIGQSVGLDVASSTCQYDDRILVDVRVIEYHRQLLVLPGETAASLHIPGHVQDFETQRCRLRVADTERFASGWRETPSTTGDASGSFTINGDLMWTWQLGADAQAERRAISSLAIYRDNCWNPAIYGPFGSVSFSVVRSVTGFNTPSGASPQVSERFAAFQGGTRHLPTEFNAPIVSGTSSTVGLDGLTANDFDPPLDDSADAGLICFGLFRSMSATGTGPVEVEHTASDFEVVVEPAALGIQ